MARRTRHTWECLQSFEFKYKKNLAAGNTVENTFDPLKKKKKSSTLLMYYVEKFNFVPYIRVEFLPSYSVVFYLFVCFLVKIGNFCSDDVAA